MQGLSRKSQAIVNITNNNGLCDINAAWQPKRVDWNAYE